MTESDLLLISASLLARKTILPLGDVEQAENRAAGVQHRTGTGSTAPVHFHSYAHRTRGSSRSPGSDSSGPGRQRDNTSNLLMKFFVRSSPSNYGKANYPYINIPARHGHSPSSSLSDSLRSASSGSSISVLHQKEARRISDQLRGFARLSLADDDHEWAASLLSAIGRTGSGLANGDSEPDAEDAPVIDVNVDSVLPIDGSKEVDQKGGADAFAMPCDPFDHGLPFVLMEPSQSESQLTPSPVHSIRDLSGFIVSHCSQSGSSLDLILVTPATPNQQTDHAIPDANSNDASRAVNTNEWPAAHRSLGGDLPNEKAPYPFKPLPPINLVELACLESDHSDVRPSPHVSLPATASMTSSRSSSPLSLLYDPELRSHRARAGRDDGAFIALSMMDWESSLNDLPNDVNVYSQIEEMISLSGSDGGEAREVEDGRSAMSALGAAARRVKGGVR